MSKPEPSVEEVADRIALRVDKRFVLFPRSQECADAAAPVFRANRWRWTGDGVPDWAEILRTLVLLRSTAEQNKQDYCESGRLVYYKGQFGYERPKTGHQGRKELSNAEVR